MESRQLLALSDIYLKPHQEETVDFIQKNKRVIIADAPRVGKTLGVVTAIEDMNAYPCLVLCPLSLSNLGKITLRL